MILCDLLSVFHSLISPTGNICVHTHIHIQLLKSECFNYGLDFFLNVHKSISYIQWSFSQLGTISLYWGFSQYICNICIIINT